MCCPFWQAVEVCSPRPPRERPPLALDHHRHQDDNLALPLSAGRVMQRQTASVRMLAAACLAVILAAGGVRDAHAAAPAACTTTPNCNLSQCPCYAKQVDNGNYTRPPGCVAAVSSSPCSPISPAKSSVRCSSPAVILHCVFLRHCRMHSTSASPRAPQHSAACRHLAVCIGHQHQCTFLPFLVGCKPALDLSVTKQS